MVKKIFSFLVAVVLMFGVFGLTGCSNGRTFDVDGWTLYRFNGNNNTERGRVNIVSANSESLVVDGVLTIPSKIGKYNIYGFGRPDNYYGPKGLSFTVSENLTVERIVIDKNLHVDDGFWGRTGKGSSFKYVEFLCNDFTMIKGMFRTENRGITYIIPDGSMENFVEKFGRENFDVFTVIEKSDYLEEKNNV